MARIYLASSWRNEFQQEMVWTLRAHNHEVYDFRNPFNGIKGFAWSDAGMPPKEELTANEYRRILTTSPVCALGFMNDFRAMQWADVCVLLLPCGRSAHLEAGWFCGAGKRCIILTQDGEEPELMALMATDICISPQEVIDLLMDRPA